MEQSITEILNFIYNIPDWRKYMSGDCYKFYLILKEKFSSAECYYNSDHVITKINDRYYDASGEVERDNHIDVSVYYTHEFMEEIFNV